MHEMLEHKVPLARGDTLGDQVTEMLREQIVSGQRRVGSSMPSEQALARELEVSRTVVREAVSRLKTEGFLEIRQSRGAVVARDRPRLGFSIADGDVESRPKLARILELRMGLEIEAAAIAARRGTTAALEDLAAASDAYRKATVRTDAEARRGAEADWRFHRAICVAADNDYYLEFFKYLTSALRETFEAGRRFAIERGGDSSDAAAEHDAIVRAIIARDPEAARREMRLHLERSSVRLIGRLFSDPAAPGDDA